MVFGMEWGNAASYAAGGARGAMLRRTTAGTGANTPETSSRFTAGTIAMVREGVATAVPAVEQIGQTCESIGRELRSTQQCICAARKTTPRTIATKKTRFDWLSI